ncbi:MAG: cellulose biosynthesis cyclic di-GMP-binding regulatory protein BcsB [Verrucomicrobia bacterium]|nr:cellulose biosynthesis cyclic di-GMP-binding regulatory protein BcsB [Verrucomicrobiota bacterium]
MLVHLNFVGPQELTNVQVAQGASIVQALALWAGYRPLWVSHGPNIVEDQFNVVIGTVSDCRNFLSQQEADQITNGFLGIRKIGHSSDGYILLVLGRTVADIDSTVLGLGFVRPGWVLYPDASSTPIKQVILPTDHVPFFRLEPLHPDAEESFDSLTVEGVKFVTMPGGGVSFQVFFPGYVRIDPNAQATLRVHFRNVAQTFGSSGSVEAKLNGQDLGRPTMGPAPTIGQLGEFKFPVKLFQPGLNQLTINSPVYGDSSLVLPKLPTDPKLPDLRLTASDFYPFIGQPDGSNLAVLLADRDPATLDAAWTLLARFAQSANTFFYAAQITYSEYDPARNLLIIGEYSRLPPSAQRLVSLEAFQQANINTPLADLEKAASGLNLKQVIANFVHWVNGKVNGQADKQKGLAHQRGPAETNFGVMVSSPPHQAGQGWTLLVTAVGQDALLPRVKNLVQPAFWNQIRGDIIRWGDAPDSLRAHVPGETKTGDVDYLVEFPFGERVAFKVWIGMVACLLILFVMVTGWLLTKMDEDLYVTRKKGRL